MAKRKYSKAKKMSPSVTRLWFHIIPQRGTSNYVDLSLAASVANRRFYRQSTNWAVAGMSLHAGTGTSGSFVTSKVPETWVAANAHSKAKRMWMDSQKQVLDNEPSIKARYNDFKIYLDKNMAQATLQDVSASPANAEEILMPIDRQNNTAKPGEWAYSNIVIPVDGGASAPLEYKMFMVGDDDTANNAVSIIHGYGLSRSRPQQEEPNVPSPGGWMNDIFDVADNLDEIRADVIDENDTPPYRVGDDTGQFPSVGEFYPGGEQNVPNSQIHAKNFLTTTTVGGKTHVQGGMFPCGLIRFDWDISSDENLYLAIDLVPGAYKGYLTEAY
jgi:hypothetical protein